MLRLFHVPNLEIALLKQCEIFLNDMPSKETMSMLSLSSSSDSQNNSEDGVILEQVRPKVKKPPLFKVVLLNDDYTPMEFVIEVLEFFFQMNREKATHIMLMVHTKGKGICGVYTRDVAETKSTQVNEYARANKHPLLCQVEAAGQE